MENENKVHPVYRMYEKNQHSIDAQIKFLKSIGGFKGVDITPEMKEKMAEDLERFWNETPPAMVAQIS